MIVDGAVAASPVISPDGNWVAWTTSSVASSGPKVTDLWLARVAQTAASVRLASGRARLPRWSPDSGWLYYVADTELRRLRITADGRLALIAGDEQTAEDKGPAR